MIKIEAIEELDLQGIQQLIELSVKEGYNFLERLVRDWESGENRFHLPQEQLYQVMLDGKVIGIGGITKDPYSTVEKIGRIRRFYIHPEKRGNGIGRQLIQQIITEHQYYYEKLRLRTDNELASKFYEKIGFVKISSQKNHTHEMFLGEKEEKMEITYLKGDATVPQSKGVKIIAHICNNIGGWGKGFVLAISKRWKEPEKAYRQWHRERSKNDFLLGNIQVVKVGEYLYIANMVGQQGIKTGSKGVPIRYEAVESCLVALAKEAERLNASVHMPRIGCGLAGGKWEKIEPLIQKTLVVANIETYVYDFG